MPEIKSIIQIPTNEELIADLIAVYHEMGYLTYSLYRTYGLYSDGKIVRRFGSWAQALQIANIPMRRESKKIVPMTTTVCLSCDEWFDRPTDDPSCRRCKSCRLKLQAAKSIDEEFAYTC